MQHKNTLTAPGQREALLSNNYVSGYRRPKPLSVQKELLAHAFPDLNIEEWTYAESVKNFGHSHAEGSFLIFDWRVMALEYSEAISLGLTALCGSSNGILEKAQLPIVNRFLELSDFAGKETPKLLESIETIQKNQHGNRLLVIPAQLGVYHRDIMSVDLQIELQGTAEFQLGVWQTILLLITHKERLAQVGDLGIECGGDELPDRPDFHVNFRHNGSFLMCNLGDKNPSPNFGIATGWVL